MNYSEVQIYNYSSDIEIFEPNKIIQCDYIYILMIISSLFLFIKNKNKKIIELEIKVEKLKKDIINNNIIYSNIIKKYNNNNNDKIIMLAKNICNLFLFEDICDLVNFVKKYNSKLQYDQIEYSRTRSNRTIKLIEYYNNIINDIDIKYINHKDMFYTYTKNLCNNSNLAYTQTQDNNIINLQIMREKVLLAYIKELVTLI